MPGACPCKKQIGFYSGPCEGRKSATLGSSLPKAFPSGGRWAGEAGSDEGAILYPTFPCRKGGSPGRRPNGFLLLPRWATRSPPHQSPSVTASPQGEASGLCSPTRKSAPNQGTYMGTVIAPRSKQCGTTAKTSEWERAGPKKGGPGGLPPALFPPFLGRNGAPPPESAAPPGRCAPRTASELPTQRVRTTGGPTCGLLRSPE